MSVRVMSWVYDAAPTTSPTDQAVLLAIADRCDDEGSSAYPSVATIAKKTRLDDRSVRRAIKRLQGLGVVTIERGSGRHGTNVYAVVMTSPCAGRPSTPERISGPTVTPDRPSPLTDSHPTPDTQSVPPGQTVSPPPDRRSADLSNTSCTSSTSIAAVSVLTDERLGERARAFLARVPEIYANCRSGALMRVREARDFPVAVDLVSMHPDDDRLAALYEVFLRMTSKDCRGMNRPGTVGQFAHMVPDCDSLLREHGR